MHSLAFDFHATALFDFFSATYFFIARRLFCLLRLCEFFRASCFMLILLVRRGKPAGCLRMGVPHGQRLPASDLSHGWLSGPLLGARLADLSNIDTFSTPLLARGSKRGP